MTLKKEIQGLYLVNMVGNILKKGTYLLGIEMPNKMQLTNNNFKNINIANNKKEVKI